MFTSRTTTELASRAPQGCPAGHRIPAHSAHPDDNRVTPFPPVSHETCRRLRGEGPSAWREHGGVFLPMYAESYGSASAAHKGYPFVVKIAAGKMNAVSGTSWTNDLELPVRHGPWRSAPASAAMSRTLAAIQIAPCTTASNCSIRTQGEARDVNRPSTQQEALGTPGVSNDTAPHAGRPGFRSAWMAGLARRRKIHCRAAVLLQGTRSLEQSVCTSPLTPLVVAFRCWVRCHGVDHAAPCGRFRRLPVNPGA